MNSTKKESKIVFADDIIFQLENPKLSTKKFYYYSFYMNKNIQEGDRLQNKKK